MHRRPHQQIAADRRLGTLCVASAVAENVDMAAPRFDVYVKGTPAEGNVSPKGELGDCPFSQRVMLTLEEKHVPYRKQFVNEYDMPDWIGEVNQIGKKIPFIKDHETDKWMGESSDIVAYIEELYPDPKLGTSETTSDVGEGIFPAFTEFLKAEGAEQKEKEEKLVSELRQLDEHLQKSGPYICGDKICAQCLAIAPRLYHTRIATKALKDWEIPKEFKGVYTFMDKMESRESWKNTAPTEQYVIDGWTKKLQSS